MKYHTDEEPQVGDRVSHKDPYDEKSGVPLRMDLCVLEVRATGIVVAPTAAGAKPLTPYSRDEPEKIFAAGDAQATSYLGDGVWRTEDFSLWRRAR